VARHWETTEKKESAKSEMRLSVSKMTNGEQIHLILAESVNESRRITGTPPAGLGNPLQDDDE
jgi:hypothetical protein